jgi:vanillate O-demethylase ferredoxin subunit
MMEVRVARKATEALDICTFELVPANGGALPPFGAGSHIDVEVAAGLVRQYSLCNDPGEQHRYVIGVLRDPNTRGGSAGMHEHVAEGSVIRISEPRNHFPLAHNARRSLLLAGGIGVTPILCMAERLAVAGADFEMHYCTRSRERTAFTERIRRSAFSDRVHFHHDDGDAAQKLDLPSLLAAPRPDTHLYVCGPGGFLDFVISTAKAHGWSESNIHFEYFSAKVVAGESDAAFDVKIASSGRVVRIPVGCPITMALDQAGVAIPVSCEQGVCGTCLTRVLGGEPDHRDHYLTDDEKAKNDQMLPCCSRAKGPLLVLDL